MALHDACARAQGEVTWSSGLRVPWVNGSAFGHGDTVLQFVLVLWVEYLLRCCLVGLACMSCISKEACMYVCLRDGLQLSPAT